jgi:hypothetical protein
MLKFKQYLNPLVDQITSNFSENPYLANVYEHFIYWGLSEKSYLKNT